MKTLVRPVKKVKAAVLGLDVHQSKIVYAHLDREGDDVATGSIPATEEDLRRLVQQVAAGRALHVAFEAGGSTFWVHDLLVDCIGKSYVHVAQSKKIRSIANTKSKTDENDAWWLAYLTFEGRLPECFVPTGVLREIRLATRERFEVVQLATRVKVRVRSLLRQQGIRLPGQRLDSTQNWNALVDLCEELEGVAGEILNEQLAFLETLLAAKAHWEEVIEKLAEDLPEVRIIEQAIPGAGKTLAAVLAAELGPLERFTTASAVANYAGLTPSSRTSIIQNHGSITREGSEHLRWALTQVAMACTRARRGPGLAVGDWIRTKERRMGNKSKARTAAARKIAESIWRLFHLGERFDAARAFGGT
jgi:transposase